MMEYPFKTYREFIAYVMQPLTHVESWELKQRTFETEVVPGMVTKNTMSWVEVQFNCVMYFSEYPSTAINIPIDGAMHFDAPLSRIQAQTLHNRVDDYRSTLVRQVATG